MFQDLAVYHVQCVNESYLHCRQVAARNAASKLLSLIASASRAELSRAGL